MYVSVRHEWSCMCVLDMSGHVCVCVKHQWSGICVLDISGHVCVC
jgi:hypothetical protein